MPNVDKVFYYDVDGMDAAVSALLFYRPAPNHRKSVPEPQRFPTCAALDASELYNRCGAAGAAAGQRARARSAAQPWSPACAALTLRAAARPPLRRIRIRKDAEQRAGTPAASRLHDPVTLLFVGDPPPPLPLSGKPALRPSLSARAASLLAAALRVSGLERARACAVPSLKVTHAAARPRAVACISYGLPEAQASSTCAR